MVEDFEDPELEALVEEGLAEIAAYADIRVKWPSESSDFTPWLADNIHLLGAELGMKLSDVRREFRIGADRADLRATASDGRTVIIECQLDRSDNGHFGQIMAYGSGVDADVLVWIAADFRDKHREAFDWINTKTGPACELYAVKVGIGKGCEGCTGQPQLNLVARPRAYRELIDPKDLASCAIDDEDLAVLTLLYQGSKVDEVASKFDWSLSKAKHRASAIYAKLGVNTKADALVVALRMGIVG